MRRAFGAPKSSAPSHPFQFWAGSITNMSEFRFCLSTAIAGAMIWPRVSSSGGIGDAASVSVNAMGRRPGRGRRRSRNSSNTTSDEWPGSKELGPFRLRLRRFWSGGPSGLDEPVLCLSSCSAKTMVSVNWWKSNRHQPSTSEQLTMQLLTPPPFVN